MILSPAAPPCAVIGFWFSPADPPTSASELDTPTVVTPSCDQLLPVGISLDHLIRNQSLPDDVLDVHDRGRTRDGHRFLEAADLELDVHVA